MDKLRIVVVGAGAAGLAAAARLMERGVGDVVVLEAEDRMGGRIHTTGFGKPFLLLYLSCTTLKAVLLWDLQHRMVIPHRCFGMTYWSHLRGSRSAKRISQKRTDLIYITMQA
jgi:cation diffusion facilitator CzcD-associated flavoprotein CzcO